jgi:hypothetical protein
MVDNTQTTPKIEDEIREALAPDLRDGALEFISHLNENAMTPRLWFGPGFWIVPHGDRNLFGIHIYGKNPASDKNGWVFWFFNVGYSGDIDEEIANFTRNHAGACVNCYSECESKGVNISIFGEAYEKLCYQFPVRVDNPDAHAYEIIKKLIEYIKVAAKSSNGLHVR